MLNKGNKDGKDRQSEETTSHVAVRHALTLQGLWKSKDAQALADTGWIFLREETTMSRSRPVEQNEPLPHNHHLQPFLTCLKQERGFADATIVNRKRSLKPFLAWLAAQGVPLSSVSAVVITKYFTSAVAGRWNRTSVSFHVQSLRSFFRYASCRGWCAAGIAGSIDAPRLYSYENLPQEPSWEEVRKLLGSVNGTSTVQIRSRCAILLCAVCGLRVGEVCRLRVEDIDWAEGENLRAPSQTEESPNLSPDDRSGECTSALSEGGQATVCPPRSLADTQTAIPSCFRCRSFHDDSKATEATRHEAQAIWLACSASHDGRSPSTCRRGHQHDTGVARTCFHRHHQRLCRSRS